MELSPISASLGAMRSLPRKLDELLATKHWTLRGIVMDKIQQLTADLRILHKFMLKLSTAQDPTMSARCWMKHVRELSYDMEDFADQFVQAHGRAKIRRATRRKLVSRLKISRLLDGRKWRPWITKMVTEFRTRSQDATRRYRRYKLDDCFSNPGYPRIGHELPTMLQDPDDLVGIEGPMNELERWLINSEEEQLKVVSIVGVGGIGKTTLAQKLWGKLHVQFECGAFVRTAQKPDMRGILRNILLQVRPNQPPNAGDMRHLMNDLREYLQGKRYLIIIDDLWSTSVWDVVSRAFPQSDCCSRIITMTEIMEVALACCCFFPEHIFKMEYLGDNDSQKLLLQRILVSGNQSPQQFDDVITQIVRICGGLPLAIIIVGRILGSQPEKLKQWGSASKSFDSIFGVNPTMEGFMGQILNLCFIILPHYLKTCLLYLSTYPEGYLFLKNDLVKQWVAEGFICANKGEDMEEVARRYFDELVSMGLIQVMDINCNYEMFSYSVHQLVLDLIKYKSIEENFITVVDYSQTTIPLNDKVRRLALHFGSATYATTPTSSRLSQVRSLFFSGLFNCMPSFVEFKLLRVLILHVWDDTGTTELNLTGICELLQLRYLQVTCNVIVKLPDRIAGMKHLETLEINTRECDVPTDIVGLSSLLHLRLKGANLPSGIGGIRSLRTLMYFDLGNSSEDSLRGLGELINLQDLHLTYSSSPSSEHLKRNLIALAASVGKLCNLKYLTLAPGGIAAARVILFDGSSDMSMPMFLERLELLPPICIFSRLPKWIGQLRKICIVKVAVRELPTTDIAILTGLPSLTVLWLSVQTAPEGRTVFNNHAFPVLKYFKFTCGVLCMSFVAGAMPDLRRLKLAFITHTGEEYDNMLAGIEHLSKLQDIVVQIGGTTGSDWKAAESAINKAIDKHPRFPGRNFQRVDPVVEEVRPSEKHHWSNEKSSLDEKLQDIVVEIGAATGSDPSAAESEINEDIEKHPRLPKLNLQCVEPIAEDFRPSKKHKWSNEKSTLDEKHGVLEKSIAMNKRADSGPSQLLNLPSSVTSGSLKSGSSVEESKESPVSSSQFPVGLGSTASVAQLVGTVGRLISKIIDAARTARQNTRECEHLTARLSIIGQVLPRLPQDAEVKPSLTELCKTLVEADKLVIACQSWSTARQLIGARHLAESLKQVNARIDSHINLLNLVINTRPPNQTATVPSPGCSSGPAAPVSFTWAQIAAATDYFAVELSRRNSEVLYKGRLRDGPEVAVKVLSKNGRQDDVEGAVVAEVEILSPLHHPHIVPLVGWCSEEDDRIIVYHHEHMSNGTLRDHLLRLRVRTRVRARLRGGSSFSSSPVRSTWKTRVDVLLGASRAIQHLHRCGVIHRNVTSFNVLLDGSWAPRLSGFGQAILLAAAGDQVVTEVLGTPGYVDPEYHRTARVSAASDVYSFGVVILETLTGEDPATMQMDSVLLAIRNRKLRDVLVRRPDATPRQLEALELVAHTAECCLFPHGNDRPAMSNVVANLERALTIINTKQSAMS